MSQYDGMVENEKINAQRAQIERLQRENAELREVLSGCTGDLAAYAFSEYGHDAKLYNGIVSLQAKPAAAEWARGDGE